MFKIKLLKKPEKVYNISVGLRFKRGVIDLEPRELVESESESGYGLLYIDNLGSRWTASFLQTKFKIGHFQYIEE